MLGREPRGETVCGAVGDDLRRGYLIRTVVDVPTETVPQNVYTLSAKGRSALELRSPAAVEMIAGRRFNETLRTASLARAELAGRFRARLRTQPPNSSACRTSSVSARRSTSNSMMRVASLNRDPAAPRLTRVRHPL